MQNYDKIIEYILNKMDCRWRIKGNYYSCQNPISKSVGNPDKNWSAAWYRFSGSLRIFNADQINNKELASIEEYRIYEYEEIDIQIK